MNNLFIYTLSLLFTMAGAFPPARPAAAPAKAPMTMCHGGAEGMSAFVSDPAFVAMHPAPLPLAFDSLGSHVTFKTPDGKTAGAYFIILQETIQHKLQQLRLLLMRLPLVVLLMLRA